MAQEALLRAWRYRDRCRTPEDPWSWLAAIVRNEAWRRRPDGRLTTVPLEQATDVAAGDDRVTRTPDRLALQRAVTGLSARDRSIVLLHYGADLPVSRIADELVIPVGTVKVTLQRIRSKLRLRLSS